MQDIAIGVITYYGYLDAVNFIDSVIEKTPNNVHVILQDNTPEPDSNVLHYYKEKCEDAGRKLIIAGTGKNHGCSTARNRILAKVVEHGYNYFFVSDQDVIINNDECLQHMLFYMKGVNNAGAVGLPECNLGEREVDKHNRIEEMATVFTLYRTNAVLSVSKNQEGHYHECWDDRFFMHKFDTLMCLEMNNQGWYTYRYPVKDLIIHNHPHQGVKRNPEWKKHFNYSKKLLQYIVETEKPYLQYERKQNRY